MAINSHVERALRSCFVESSLPEFTKINSATNEHPTPRIPNTKKAPGVVNKLGGKPAGFVDAIKNTIDNRTATIEKTVDVILAVFFIK